MPTNPRDSELSVQFIDVTDDEGNTLGNFDAKGMTVDDAWNNLRHYLYNRYRLVNPSYDDWRAV